MKGGDEMDFLEYIRAELLILIPVLYLIGMGLKKTNIIANKWIPILIGSMGIVLSMVYVLATMPIANMQSIGLAMFTAFTQGILVSGASVYTNQIFKQFTSKGNSNDRE